MIGVSPVESNLDDFLSFIVEVSTPDLWVSFGYDSRGVLLFCARQVFALNPDK